MARPLSDAEMAQLEAQHAPAQKPLSDEEMMQLESQHAEPQAPQAQGPQMQSPEYLRTFKGRINEGMATPDQITAGANNAAAMMTGGLSKAIPAMGRGIMTAIGEGGLLGAAQSPDDRLKGFLTGGAIQGGMTGAGKILSKVGDVSMQMGVGRNKYTPGVGNELAKQGLMGTRGMLKEQTAKRLDDVGSQMGRVADDISGIDSRRIGQEMSEELTGPLTGKGIVTPRQRDLGELEQYRAAAEDVASGGMETGQQALARRGAAGSSAYSAKSLDPKVTPVGKAAKLEQQKYSQALKEADPRMVPLDASYAALAKARHGLKAETPLTGAGLILGAGGRYGGALPATAIGQATDKGGRLAEFLAPLLRQSAVNRSEK